MSMFAMHTTPSASLRALSRASSALKGSPAFMTCIRPIATTTSRSQVKNIAALNNSWKQPRRTFASEPPKGSSSHGQQKPFQQRPLASALAHSTERKQWKDLTPTEKVATATRTTTNYTVVAAGVVLVGAITYAIISELFGSNSDTRVFGDALEKVRSNEKLQEIIGSPMMGHGEPSSSKRRRNRRIHSQVVTDAEGKDHFLMRFYVEGPYNEGTAHLEMVKDENDRWEYKYLFVDIPGGVRRAERVFVEYNKDAGKSEEEK